MGKVFRIRGPAPAADTPVTPGNACSKGGVHDTESNAEKINNQYWYYRHAKVRHLVVGAAYITTGEKTSVTTDDDDPITDDRGREVIRMLSNGLRQARATRLWTTPADLPE